TPIAAAAGSQPIYLRLPLLARSPAQRAVLIARLRRAGIGAGRLYGHTLAEILRRPFPAALLGPTAVNLSDDFPGATEIAQRLLTLPTHPYMRESDLALMRMEIGDQRRGEGEKGRRGEGQKCKGQSAEYKVRRGGEGEKRRRGSGEFSSSTHPISDL
ncbi:MAG: hypothetical protein WAV70_13110, partial [Anaerolineae bacterium]